MNNERMPKQVATARMEGVGERGRPLKEWNNEVEEEIGVVWSETGGNVGGLYWILRSTLGYSA